MGNACFLVPLPYHGKPGAAVKVLCRALGMQLHLALALAARSLHQRIQHLAAQLGAAQGAGHSHAADAHHICAAFLVGAGQHAAGGHAHAQAIDGHGMQ
ncbi:hypothetical protein D3C71_2042660 [compost metagenome]